MAYLWFRTGVRCLVWFTGCRGTNPVQLYFNLYVNQCTEHKTIGASKCSMDCITHSSRPVGWLTKGEVLF